jgi:hypothetical protein
LKKHANGNTLLLELELPILLLDGLGGKKKKVTPNDIG